MKKTFRFETRAGNIRITGASVTICATNNPAFRVSYEATTADFSLEIDVEDNTYYYATVRINSYDTPDTTQAKNISDQNVTFLAVFNNTTDLVPVTPHTTIACAFAFARFLQCDSNATITLSGETTRLNICFGMMYNLVDKQGGISKVMEASPNHLQTNSLGIINSFCDLACASITSFPVYADFLQHAGAQSSFFGALLYLVHHPYTSVPDIYSLLMSIPGMFVPSLQQVVPPPGSKKSAQPDQWTVAVKANNSGSVNFMISGTASVVFDADDKAWIANNFRQGTANSGTHCIVLNPDLTPCSFSPLTGGGILGVGFGSAITADKKTIAFGSYGWGPTDYNPQPGGAAVFNWQDGKPISPTNGYTTGLSRVQGMCYDDAGNLWMASWGTQKPMAPAPDSLYEPYPDQPSAVVVYIGGDPDNAVSFSDFYDANGNISPSPFHNTFDIAIDQNGYAFASNAGSKANDKDQGYDHPACPSAVYKLLLNTEQKTLTCEAHWISNYEDNFEEFRQINVNSKGDVYVGGVTSSRVVQLSNDLSRVKGTFTKNIDAPWGVGFDKNDTMYVANFSKGRAKVVEYKTLDMTGPFGVTIITNDDPETATMMTLPTGGMEVLLANGQPLYGSQTGPDGTDGPGACYEPLMRLTSTNIDRAGNLWAMNNWKPSLYTDVMSNPGGDGVVVFLGVAEPA